MTRVRLIITAAVPIHGHAPGEEFFVRSTDGKSPSERIWRKRIAEGAAGIVKRKAKPRRKPKHQTETLKLEETTDG